MSRPGEDLLLVFSKAEVSSSKLKGLQRKTEFKDEGDVEGVSIDEEEGREWIGSRERKFSGSEGISTPPVSPAMVKKLRMYSFMCSRVSRLAGVDVGEERLKSLCRNPRIFILTSDIDDFEERDSQKDLKLADFICLSLLVV